jgi:glycosyltransferase involved in cell wall biosynthesis
MRALWLVRPDLDREPGGDTTQIHETAAALGRLGVSVVLSSDPEPELGELDVVHLFHLDRIWENARRARLIRRLRVPAVLSPLFWPTTEFDRQGRHGLQGLVARALGTRGYQRLRIAQRAGKSLWGGDTTALDPLLLGFERGARLVLESVNVLLPNSHTEQRELERCFGVHCDTVPVPNGVNTRRFGRPPEGWDLDRSGVLCVGRIEPRKNQLALIRAVRNTGIHVKLVGRSGPYSRAYEKRCWQEAGAEIDFLGYRGEQELRELYWNHRVHVSTSWYETPGLASLEAAACGCAIVTSAGGCTREYFEDEAEYCDPGDPASIRAALEKALARPTSSRLATRVLRSFTWDAAARATLDGYELAIRVKHPD